MRIFEEEIAQFVFVLHHKEMSSFNYSSFIWRLEVRVLFDCFLNIRCYEYFQLVITFPISS